MFAAVTRSWWLTLLVTALHGLWIVGLHDIGVSMNSTTTRSRLVPGLGQIAASPYFLWSWHAATYAGLLLWAIRARLKLPKPGYCIRCGYNLAGVSSPACPECGRAINPTNAAFHAALISSAAHFVTAARPAPFTIPITFLRHDDHIHNTRPFRSLLRADVARRPRHRPAHDLSRLRLARRRRARLARQVRA